MSEKIKRFQYFINLNRLNSNFYFGKNIILQDQKLTSCFNFKTYSYQDAIYDANNVNNKKMRFLNIEANSSEDKIKKSKKRINEIRSCRSMSLDKDQQSILTTPSQIKPLMQQIKLQVVKLESEKLVSKSSQSPNFIRSSSSITNNKPSPVRARSFINVNKK
jgi:hypothetical protein